MAMNNTTDISDALHPNVQYVESCYQSFGAKSYFEGCIVTIKCFEDNSLVKQLVEEPGQGKVMVVDAGGSKRCAMLGDMLAEKAMTNGWEGVLIYGMIRDSREINTMNIGIKALGTHPLKSIKKGIGEQGITLQFSGVCFTPDEYLYADGDGIIVTQHPL